MPDWCVNDLSVGGPPDSVTAFCSRVAGFPQSTGENLLRGALAGTASTPLIESLRLQVNNWLVANFDFQNTHPTPPELLEASAPFRGDGAERERLVSLYGAADWYDWQVGNWGVKWGPRNVSTHATASDVHVSFWTPWGPPLVWADKVAREHPGLDLLLEWSVEDDFHDSIHFFYDDTEGGDTEGGDTSP